MIKRWVAIFAVFSCLIIPRFLDAQDRPSQAPVEVSLVENETVEKKVTLTGTVFPRTKSVLASEVEGLVEKIFVEEGDFIKKGKKIAELGASTYRLRLQEAVAAQNETEQRYLQAQADLKRSEELVAKGFVPEKQVLDDRFNTVALSKKLRQH
ncbi:MAG: biotin/lipoyl-binding protein, partial [candidate division Zixibacteria bacterium]|nr:biotin/lipoyl-binding protein [candidate division Zixibacteria bacterium]